VLPVTGNFVVHLVVNRYCCGVSAGPLYCVVTVLLPVPGNMSFTASLVVAVMVLVRGLAWVVASCYWG
jgi:hypothetical protein